MKHRLVELLRCPTSGATLTLNEFASETTGAAGTERTSPACRRWCSRYSRAPADVEPSACDACLRHDVVEGELVTADGTAYPVISGVPRLLPPELLAKTLRYHPEFLARHGRRFSAAGAAGGGEDAKARTLRAFSYQWTTFTDNFDYFRPIFLSFVRPFLGPEDFDGRLVLEVGCGSGRPASVAAGFGAEVVGVDLSEAVVTAQARARQQPGMHVVQGDAYSLPVAPEFDFVYSVGVLQHLPDPARALHAIARVVPAGHPLVLWVYGRREAWYAPIDWLRRLTVRMPLRGLHALSWVLAVLSELALLTPYRLLNAVSFVRPLARRIPGRIYADLPFRENVLGWFDRLGAPVTHYFSRQDVETMLQAAGFDRIEIAARPDASASWVVRCVRR